jgi:hypothetical protein
MRTEKHYTQQELNAMSNEDLRLDRATFEQIKTKGESSIPASVWVVLFTLLIVVSYVIVGFVLMLLCAGAIVALKTLFSKP